MNGGGLFETGAGGSAPKHVQQFTQEGHLRWDSLGEFMAIVVSLEHLAEVNDNPKAKILADTLDAAIESLLKNGKSPMRKVRQLDNRGSHFYLAMYWANELASQTEYPTLKAIFDIVSTDLQKNEGKIVNELNNAQGRSEDVDGYYFPDPATTFKAMRPSETLNNIVDSL